MNSLNGFGAFSEKMKTIIARSMMVLWNMLKGLIFKTLFYFMNIFMLKRARDSVPVIKQVGQV